MKTKVLIGSHRGNTSNAFENTKKAFIDAVSSKAELIEFDIRKTKDNVLICCHDNEIGSLKTSETTYQELKYKAKETGFNLAIPQDVIQTAGNKLIIDAELKEEGYEKEIIELFSEIEKNKLLFTSFNIDSMKKIKKISRNYSAGFLYYSKKKLAPSLENEIIETLKQNQIDFFLPHFTLLNKKLVQNFLNSGIKIITWTVNDKNILEQILKENNITGVITDKLDEFIKIKNEMNSD